MEILPKFAISTTPRLTVDYLRALLRDLSGTEDEKWAGVIVGDQVLAEFRKTIPPPGDSCLGYMLYSAATWKDGMSLKYELDKNGDEYGILYAMFEK